MAVENERSPRQQQGAEVSFGIAGKALPHRSYATALLLRARPSRPVYPKTYVDSLAPLHVPITTLADLAGYGMACCALMLVNFVLLAWPGVRPTTELQLRRLTTLPAVYTAAVLGAMTAQQTKLHLAALPRHYRGLLLMGAELTDSNIHFRIMSDMKALPSSSPLLRAIITVLGACAFLAVAMLELVWPHAVSSLLGYTKELAVRELTKILIQIDEGLLPGLARRSLPAVALDYWGLDEDTHGRELILYLRADDFWDQFRHLIGPRDSHFVKH